MAIPQGDITTSEILVPEVVQDPVQVLEEEQLPVDDFDPEQV
jgi:hypothetical protein